MSGLTLDPFGEIDPPHTSRAAIEPVPGFCDLVAI